MTKLKDKNTREYRLYHNITTPEQEMQGLEAIVRNLKQERDELRAERDEARREVCNATAHPDMEAHERGWDCFKDNP